MIRFDLILIFRDRAQNVWWYWHTPEEAVSWARDTFRDVQEIRVAWSLGSGLKLQAWKPQTLTTMIKDKTIDPARRWECLEMD